jgi:hypothetical protein
MKASTSNAPDIKALREELKSLRDRNLDETAFEEKLEIICWLSIKVYPSEDLRPMRVACQLRLYRVQSDTESAKASTELQADGECEPGIECRKVKIGSPSHAIDRTFRIVMPFP